MRYQFKKKKYYSNKNSPFIKSIIHTFQSQAIHVHFLITYGCLSTYTYISCKPPL